jgi:tetratricopeptide (TPR) repeat protein
VGAAEEFVRAWDSVWKPQGVRKFVLCIACEVRTPVRRQAIAAAENMVRSLEIACETWSLTKLVERLRHHPTIVTHFLSAEWAHRLCAPFPLVSGEASIAKVEALRAQIAQIERSQEPLIDVKIEQLRKLSEQGFLTKVFEEAETLQAEPDIWPIAQPEQKAAILRLAALRAWPHDPETFAGFIRRANTFAPPTDRYFEARILHCEKGAQAAFDLMDHPRTSRESVYRAALCLEQQNPQLAIDILGEDEPYGIESSWHYRVRAIAEASLGRFTEAIMSADASLKAAPDNWASGIVRAAILYNSSLSPSLGLVGLDKPRPFPPSFLKQDAESIALRQHAVSLFESFLVRAPEPEEQQNIATWVFAHTLLLQGGSGRAAAAFAEALHNGLLAPGMVDWMLARGLPFEQEQVIVLFETRLSQSPFDLACASALVSIYQIREDPAAIRNLLERHGSSLRRISSTDVERLAALAAHLECPDASYGRGLLTEHSVSELCTFLADPGADPVVRYESARILAHRGKWTAIAEAEEFLLKDVSTGSALDLAAHARAVLRPGQPTLDLIDQYGRQMFANDLPVELETLRIDALANAGDLAGAITAAEQRFQDPADPRYLLRAQYLVAAGNVRGASRAIARATKASNPGLGDVRTLMGWAHTISREDIPTARFLTEQAFAQDSEQAIYFGAAFLALEIMPEHAEPFMRRMHEVALANPGGPIRLATFDDTKTIMLSALEASHSNAGLYADGKIFGHAILRQELALHYLTPFLSRAPFRSPPPQIAHAVGGRVREIGEVDTLVLDTTAILIAEALGLRPALDRAGLQIVLPASWSGALLEMERAARPKQSDYRNARQSVLRLVGQGKVRVVRSRPVGSLAITAAEEVLIATDIAHNAITEALINTWAGMQRSVFLPGGIAETLAYNSLLAPLCSAARVCISPAHYRELLDQERQDANGAAVADALAALRQHFFIDLRDGHIRTTGIAPQSSEEEHDDPADKADTDDDVFFHALRQVIASDPGPRGALWIDDRFLTGHGQTPNAPIVGVQSVLGLLQARGALSGSERQGAIRKMRQFGFSHLLPTPQEIIAQLSLAAHGDAEAEEDLKAARHAFSRFSLIPDQTLGSPGPHAMTEQDAASSMFFLANRVIQQVLEQTPFSAEAELPAILWTIDNFRMDWRSGANEKSAALIAQAWHASLVLAFLARAGDWIGSDRDRASDLLEAIYDQRIRRALHVQPGAIDALNAEIARTVRSFLLDQVTLETDEELLTASFSFASGFCEICPSDLKSVLVGDPDISRILGFETGVQVADVFFPASEFWNALDRISAGDARADVEASTGRLFAFTTGSDGRIEARSGTTVLPAFMPIAVCAPDARTRRDSFSRFLSSARFSDADATRFRRRFGQARSAQRREALLAEARAAVEGRLHQLARKKNGSQMAAEEIAPPDLVRMTAWLGYDATTASAEGAFACVADQHGVQEAICRWSSVPVLLPPAAHVWLASLSDEDARAAGASLLDLGGDVISSRNLLELFSSRQSLADLREAILARVDAETTQARLTQLDLARASNYWLGAKCLDPNKFTLTHAAAWAWAGQLVSRLGPIGVRLEPLAEFFLTAARDDRRALFYHMRSMDAGDPNVLDNSAYLAGLSEAFLRIATRPFVQDALDLIAKEISVGGAGSQPSPFCLRSGLLPNRFGTWLTRAPETANSLLFGEDEFAAAIFTDRNHAQEQIFAAPRLDLTRLVLTGSDCANLPMVKRILMELRRDIPRLDGESIVPALLVLSDIAPAAPVAASSLRKRYAELAGRQSLIGAAGDQHEAIMFKLVLDSASGILRHQSNDWPSFEDLLLRLARSARGNDRHNIANAIRIFADILPVAERPRALRIVAQINTDFPE